MQPTASNAGLCTASSRVVRAATPLLWCCRAMPAELLSTLLPPCGGPLDPPPQRAPSIALQHCAQLCCFACSTATLGICQSTDVLSAYLYVCTNWKDLGLCVMPYIASLWNRSSGHFLATVAWVLCLCLISGVCKDMEHRLLSICIAPASACDSNGLAIGPRQGYSVSTPVVFCQSTSSTGSDHELFFFQN